jgi:arsenate reductase
MAEIGIDSSRNRSKSIEEFRGENFNYVVTVCDGAREACPFFSGKEIIHKSFEDPSQFKGSEEEILKQVKRVRDEISEWIKNRFV